MFQINYVDDSVESSAEDYGIQNCDDVFGDDETMAVMCVVITNDASFAPSPSIKSSASTSQQIRHLL